METQTLPSVDEIIKVVSGHSSSEGATREVFIFGDLVIKRDKGGYHFSANAAEIAAYNKFVPGDHTLNGITYSIKVPRMAMVGEYLIAERVLFPHIAVYDEFEPVATCEHEYNYEECEPCSDIAHYIEYICENIYGIFDMHPENFMWDADTNTAWLVDIGA